jgi:protein arginine N-methyltransferase 1
VGYFECAFTQIHKPIVFSTSPHARYTHWKQTVFYLQNELTVCAGEELRARIKCWPNTRNHRDLDIDMHYEFNGKNNEAVICEQKFHLR